MIHDKEPDSLFAVKQVSVSTYEKNLKRVQQLNEKLKIRKDTIKKLMSGETRVLKKDSSKGVGFKMEIDHEANE